MADIIDSVGPGGVNAIHDVVLIQLMLKTLKNPHKTAYFHPNTSPRLTFDVSARRPVRPDGHRPKSGRLATGNQPPRFRPFVHLPGHNSCQLRQATCAPRWWNHIRSSSRRETTNRRHDKCWLSCAKPTVIWWSSIPKVDSGSWRSAKMPDGSKPWPPTH